MYSFIGILLLVLASSRYEVLGASLQPRAVSDGSFYMCTNGGLATYCMGSIQTAWNQGHFQVITSEHKFFSDPANSCKVTSWSLDWNTVRLQSVNQFQDAARQMDDFCILSKRPLASPSVDLTEYHNAYVGRVSNGYVVIQLDIEPATYRFQGGAGGVHA
ncbi:uncharacterized protein MELLADRAFT_106648 [Melampsora larici-populina 98AG31]|uniref:Secreted protein n=1 Tax=Melampsora larici-populina (strain 98AG31 / pathotype 3-4-7) TaxID=747676 RepID=F4RM66_MELLP|nr:uncharacterized protein MELLADRAFT_106648 [Melampsora larici-populina 98AG31]EGG06521.1 hypothetical protein MELLADRAFT_106648 [Melampsora larici-populina 98AG31]